MTSQLDYLLSPKGLFARDLLRGKIIISKNKGVGVRSLSVPDLAF